MSKDEKLLKVYRGSTMGAVHTLILMFVLGMIANLYVEIPSMADGNAWAWSFGHSGVIIAHVVLGTILVLVSLASLVLALFLHKRLAITASSLGFAFTLLAYGAGAEFLSAGQTNLASLLMSLGFIGAAMSYGFGLLKLRK